jgi:hypothetical protein
MNEIKVTGKIEQVLDYKSGVGANSGKAWSKQGYLLAYKRGEHEYDAKLAFDVWGDDRIKAFGLKVGDVVTLTLDIASREYNGRWYTDITAYRCEHVGVEEEPAPQPAPAPKPQSAVPNGVPYTEPYRNEEQQKEDDLPF